jgi:hypothetical protein
MLSPGLAIYAADANISAWFEELLEYAEYGGKLSPHPIPLCRIVPHQTQGRHCQLIFELEQGSWADAREALELLIEDFRRDGLVEVDEAYAEQPLRFIAPPKPNELLAPQSAHVALSQQEKGKDDPMPLLPTRVKSEQWYAWFDWYYRQPWGPVPSKLAHMADLTGKPYNTVAKRHADYMLLYRQ